MIHFIVNHLLYVSEVDGGGLGIGAIIGIVIGKGAFIFHQTNNFFMLNPLYLNGEHQM